MSEITKNESADEGTQAKKPHVRNMADMNYDEDILFVKVTIKGKKYALTEKTGRASVASQKAQFKNAKVTSDKETGERTVDISDLVYIDIIENNYQLVGDCLFQMDEHGNFDLDKPVGKEFAMSLSDRIVKDMLARINNLSGQDEDGNPTNTSGEDNPKSDP